MGIKIVTDSTSYIPKELLEKYDIAVVSLGIVMEGKGQKEVEINNDEFYEKLGKLDSIPTSSQPTIEDLYKRRVLSGLLNNNVIERVIVLSNREGVGTIENIYSLNGGEKECLN